MAQPILNQKNAIITGASQGLGKEIAREFILAGANIVICSRNKKEILATQHELVQLSSPKQKVIAISTDVSSELQVKRLIELAVKKLGRIDIIVNNAGILGSTGTIDKVNCKEWKKAVEINLYGPLHVMHYALPIMKKQKYGKIINISGGGATLPMPGLSAYAASKTALVRLTETIAQEVAQYNIDCNLVAPGALNTRILKQIIKAGPEIVGKNLFTKTLQYKDQDTSAFTNATKLCVYLASIQSDGISGKIISAVWDSWREFANYKTQLMNSDVYTLRRITPDDRKLKMNKKTL